jgi:tRNA threonylcarbamoyladenosine biosynthesis protein TsaB
MTFRCLAIETATDLMSLAACSGERVAAWESQPARAETQRIYQHAERLIGELGLSMQALDCVAFGCGPGSFTGVRMAAAAAQALGFALGIPVCRRSSLAVLAATALRQVDADTVGVCLDARMARVYLAVYRRGAAGDVVAVVPDALVDPATHRLPVAAPFVAVGPGWGAYPCLAERHAAFVSCVMPDLLPSALDLLSMAREDRRTGALVTPEQALPEYLGLAPASVPQGTPRDPAGGPR